ncbi:hypothetical protein Mal4_16240 [Maioricimonas rarisocia]|uniref:DUF309 domain-containing protein n=1 Tax=Maioricimonas rarisocia TaxID=2528026 RepID=A0A517Z4A8_9PLAN|nr:DUF309 domain-containing protein [Maioricimonas rarisocia]QDU37314.1 hypothetical protein Mal4_16240 [Maioricimonas rarisocia]
MASDSNSQPGAERRQPFFADWPLPPYTFVPGHAPHPIRDPAGHSFGTEPEPASPLTADNWPHSRPYLRGFDLFNAGFYWEAHETWEGAWIACGRRGTTADFLKGLIKLAAAGVKLREQNRTGAHRHVRRARELFSHVRANANDSPEFLGLSFDQLERAATALETAPSELPPTAPPTPLLPFTVVPIRT